MPKELIFSVTLDDCEVQTFRSGGSGGQNQNKRDTGVRVIHKASGARGESREERSQLQNKKTAFRRMAESQVFKSWLALATSQGPIPEALVERDMRPENLVIETREDGIWQQEV